MSNLISEILGNLTSLRCNWRLIKQIFLAGVAPILLIATIYFWQNMGNHEADSQVLSVTSSNPQATSSQAADASSSPQEKSILIDISGAVNSPGIKELSSDSRVNDAVWSAEGYTPQADKEYLAQALNLAQRLQDGDKIYIPTYTEVAQSLPKIPTLLNKIHEPIDVHSQSATSDGNQNSNSGNTSDNLDKININTATQTQLESLPGIGEVNAKNIIEGRPYASTSELCSRKVISNSTTCEKIQSLITF